MKFLLPTISSPDDLKNLSLEELRSLSGEIRARIIEVLSETGGHLASNLGSVELTVALHHVFSSPTDKFLFDTSHQTYTHKIITGRNEQLPTIRQFHGLSGFADPTESAHDHFYAGHAGTALSLALGLVKSRDLLNEDHWVIPVLGDAALTCGLTLEGMNNVQKDSKKFIVIINDNAMSISKNVGAITNILSRFVNNTTANRLYKDVEELLSKIPGYGAILSRSGHKVRESLKNLVSTAPYFEQYGFNYVGPIDGHDIEQLVDTLSSVKETDGPTVIHVLTTKGQGMLNAIENPTSYHGVKPFDPSTGKMHTTPSTKPTFPKIFGSHIHEMARKDPSIVTITPAMPAGSCIQPFMDEFPSRCLDVGIAEGHSVTFAGGIAKNPNLKVCVSIYATFSQRALDNIYHDVCLQKLPVVFAFDRGGIAGGDGATHNGIYDIGFLRGMPNMVIAQPRNGRVLRELLDASFSWNAPAVIRYPNLPTDDGETQKKRMPAEGEILRSGEKIAIIALGHMNTIALSLAEKLEHYGENPTVIDPVFIQPLDEELFHTIFKTHSHIITLEEHAVTTGLGSIINDFILQSGYSPECVYNAGIGDIFVEHGKHSLLLEELGLTAEGLLDTVAKKFGLNHDTRCTVS